MSTSLPLSVLFSATATTEIYTLSLHDALPICAFATAATAAGLTAGVDVELVANAAGNGIEINALKADVDITIADHRDRKSTRLNSCHSQISYAVFCLKVKRKIKKTQPLTRNTE